MSDSIGRITVPTVINCGQTFPLTTQYPFGFSVERAVIVHRFGSLDGKQEQRYYAGIGPRKFQFKRPNLNWSESRQLKAFWESMQGPWQAFTYNVPNPDGTTTGVLVTFEQAPISFEYLRNAAQVGLNLVEVVDPTAAPVYTVASTCLRFPSSGLASALLSEVQQIIPLVHIRTREAGAAPAWSSIVTYHAGDLAMSGGAVPAAFIATATSTNANPLDWHTNNDWRPFEIYLSDRRVTVGGQLYLPRLVAIGEAGSDVLISQDIKGASDNVRFAFGNADRIMTQLANDSDLKYADIDLCLFHVNSGILLQLWKGVIQNFQIDGTPVFPVSCSDGFFQIMNQYPERQISRQCWKTFSDGMYCPYATCGSGGDPASCDYYLESVNGCQAHGMAPFFGGHQADPQGVVIKDDSTGFLGFGRNTVTATSIISDTVWGLALPEIWCNSGGDPIKAFIAPAQLVAYRDESGYSDALGILGAGPIGGFSPSQVAQNADGFRFVVGPMLDGYLWQGFKVDSNLNVTKNEAGMGLRQIQGNDPANPNTDSFSLGQGTPQVWEPNVFAAGTAACEIRVVKSSTIQPSTPDQHQMKVPIDYGLSGWVWDASGNRSAALGLVNPFWIAVNMLLRALGVPGSVPTPLLLTNIAVTLPPSSFYNFGGSTVGVFKILAYIGNPVGYIGLLVATIGSAFTGNAFSVPMSDAANQAQNVLGQNLAAWQSMGAIYRTTANRATFVANFDAIWNAFVGACNVIIGGDPNGSDAKKALNASIGDRQRGGKFDWFASYRDPIANSATPGDSITTPDLSAQQLSKFVLSSLVVGDGSGAAEIAAAQVPAILGTGNETQFQFQGVLSAQKPFRDWLTEVLNCCLGFYTWDFGKLKLGCRINASVVDTYTPLNMLFQSLRLAPIQAAFEHLVLSFADVAYQYQANTAEYCDKSHAAYYGRAGSPLTTQMHSVGCSTLSQALRIAATRTREEIGGVNPTEWRNARTATWQTTLLGLANEVGQVVSITHPDMPTGTGAFRIQRWSLKKDWSVEIQGQTVTASMYDLDVGPKPIDVVPAPPPPLFYPIPLGPAWAPYQVQAASWDALFPNEWTFDSNQTYTTLADGSALASLIITGKLPVNEFSATGAGAPGIGSISQSATGGSLPANATLRVAVCAIDSNGLPSAPSNIAIIGTSPSGTDTFTLEGITWPAVAGLASYVLFVATQDDLICAQATAALTAGANNTYTPGSITFGGPLVRSTWALPSPYVSKIRIKAKRAVHMGVAGATVDHVNAPNQVVCPWLIDATNVFNPVGRILSVVGRPESGTPFLSVTITGYDHTTGTLTVSPQAVLSGHPELSIQAGDVVVIRNKADDINNSTPTQITDTGYQNVTCGYAGLTAGAEVGNVLRVIQGTGRGQLRKITGNTPTQLSWDAPLVLDGTSVWIVEVPSWDYTGDSTTINNADSLHAVSLNIPTDNFIDQALVIAGFTVDVNGNESPDGDVAIREDWIYGAEGLAKVAGLTLPVSGTLGIQADAAPAFYLDSDFTAGSVKAYVKSAPVGADLVFTIYAGATAWLSLTIPAGSTSVAATDAQIGGAATIPANTNVRLAITAVGTTFPGADLSVFVYS